MNTMTSDRPKVFGIGFHKTGTTSLLQALSTLGYSVTGPNWTNDPRIALDIESLVRELVPQYDAFQDTPWPVIYSFLDSEFPGSKFILTLRPVDQWLKSVVKHFGTDETEMRRWIYGVGAPIGNEDIYTNRYEQHNKDVIEYFSGREEDFLTLKITEGEGWEKLCPFLNCDLPNTPFPFANRAETREHNGKIWKRRFQKYLRMFTRLN
jgi:hypothetical protein